MNEDISYISRTRRIVGWKEFDRVYEGISEKQKKVSDFMDRDRRKAAVIPKEELKNHDVALFEVLAWEQDRRDPWIRGWSLSDVLVDFRVDAESETVTAVKIYESMEGSETETRTYYLQNYGKTWRAWDALPK